MKAVIHLGIVLLVASVLQAQTATPTAAPRKKAGKSVGADVQALKEAVAAQQQQIKALSDQLQQTNQQLQQTNQQLQQQLQQAQAAASDAATKAAAAQTQASQQQQTVGELQGDVAGLKTTSANTAMTLQETQKTVSTALDSPASLHRSRPPHSLQFTHHARRLAKQSVGVLRLRTSVAGHAFHSGSREPHGTFQLPIG
ncbi:MAG: hypothetical protein ABSD64_13485 [Terriglobales bacterium]